jgi:hypothetical protein
LENWEAAPPYLEAVRKLGVPVEIAMMARLVVRYYTMIHHHRSSLISTALFLR